MACIAKVVILVARKVFRALIRFFRRLTHKGKRESSSRSTPVMPLPRSRTAHASEESIQSSSYWRDSGISCSTTEDELFFPGLNSPAVCLYESAIQKLRQENTDLKEKLGRNYIKLLATQPQQEKSRWRMCNSWSDTGERRVESSMSMKSKSRHHSADDDTCLQQQRQIRRSIDLLVQKQLLKKLTSVEDENRRLKEFVNDVMYMLLDCTPSMLEK